MIVCTADYHDLRRMGGLRRTAESHHEGEPVSPIGKRLLCHVLCPRGDHQLSLIARQLRKRLRNQQVFLDLLDVVEANAQDVRFLQATRHGEVLTPIEFVEDHAAELGGHAEGVLKWLRQGESLGLALFRENVPEETRKNLLGHFVSEELADSLDRHYQLAFARDPEGAKQAGARLAKRWPRSRTFAGARKGSAPWLWCRSLAC